MQTIEFETPTLNEKGEIVISSRHTAELYTEDLGKGINLEMLVIPAGSFQMGSSRRLGNADEQPQHFVTIKSFMMGKFLITQAQWKAIMGKLPLCRFKGDQLPMERVSWEEAQKFCQRLSTKTRRNYQLPSETQWEYACRAGTNTPFSFGETLTIDVANFNGEHTFRHEPRGTYRHTTTEGGTFPPNAFGLYDMHGNLWECCADNWLEDYSSSPRDGSSYQKKDSRYRVARGGSWHEPPELCRSATRIRCLQSEADEVLGFRVVCEVISHSR
ncbi:MAG TPA: formylglycine-generating enzyme family protein [Anaerolineales bacterium]|nr:formylglycine-generating enzyme family protein [Anaerolineales bacterium]